jgi:hypothetical protein
MIATLVATALLAYDGARPGDICKITGFGGAYVAADLEAHFLWQESSDNGDDATRAELKRQGRLLGADNGTRFRVLRRIGPPGYEGYTVRFLDGPLEGKVGHIMDGNCSDPTNRRIP